MHIFLTGGTGYIGSAVLDALVRGGHTVDALVRNSEKAEEVQARGARAVMGDLGAPETYRDTAASANGIVHAAFEYSPKGQLVDLAALDAFVSGAPRPGRFLIYTSGVWILGPAPDPVDESAAIDPIELVAWRPDHERRVLEAAAGLRAIVVRPGIVYGGARGIVGDLFRDAANGVVRIIGSGENHWPLVYDLDLGDLYLRLANSGDASGIFHANDEGDERVDEIVAAIASQVSTEPGIRRVPLAEARQKMGAYADALALDQKVRSPRARALGWNPALESVAGNVARLHEEWRRRQ